MFGNYFLFSTNVFLLPPIYGNVYYKHIINSFESVLQLTFLRVFQEPLFQGNEWENSQQGCLCPLLLTAPRTFPSSHFFPNRYFGIWKSHQLKLPVQCTLKSCMYFMGQEAKVGHRWNYIFALLQDNHGLGCG